MKIARWMVWCLLLSAAVVISGEARCQELAGDFGDLSRLRLAGLNRFDPEHVRQELQLDFELCLAAHPLAPLEQLPGVLEARLLAGFHNAGHADAKVDVQIDRDARCLSAAIQEGPCYACGTVEITGVDADVAERLVQRLTAPYPPKEAVKSQFRQVDGQDVVQWLDKDDKPVDLAKPVWKPGQPAPLAEVSRTRIEGQIKDALADVGLRSAEFDVQMPLDAERGEARLQLTVKEAGPVDRVAWIELHTNGTTTRKMLLDYLQLGEHELLTHQLLAQVQYRLWRSGRFATSEVTPRSSEESPDGQAGLTIKLGESQVAPPLDQPLSAEAELLLKTRDMLANPDTWPSELVLHLTTEGAEYELVIHPQRGILFTSRPTDGEYRFALVMSRDAIGYYSADLPVKLECPVPDQWLYFEMGYGIGDDLKDNGKPTFKTNFNFGFKSDRPEYTTLPMGMHLEFDPAAMVALTRLPDTQTTWSDDTLTLVSERERLAVDTGDGRLQSYALDLEPGEFRFGFRDGAYDVRWKEIRIATAGLPNEFDPAYPLSSLLAFFCQEQVVYDLLDVFDSPKIRTWFDQVDREALQVVHRLLQVGMLHAIDDLFTNPTKKPDPKFDIPFTPPPAGKAAGWHTMIARGAAPWADRLFPRNTWPWTVWRETALVVAGETAFTGRQLQALDESPDVGPVGLFVISSLAAHVDKRTAERFAARGIWRTSVEDFRKDYSMLLNRDYPVGASLYRTAEILRELDEVERQKLASWIPEPYRPALAEFAAELRLGRGRPVEESLPAALDRAWEAGLRSLVLEGLNQMLPNSAFRIGGQ